MNAEATVEKVVMIRVANAARDKVMPASVLAGDSAAGSLISDENDGGARTDMLS